MKNSKRLLLTTIFLTTLLSLSAYASQVPNAHAAEMTTQEKSLSILEEVAGFNMTAYAPFLQAEATSQFLSATREEADFRLTSGQGSLRAACSFIHGKLHRIFISDYSGLVSLKQPSTDAVSMAKDFMQNYQSYTGASLYGNLNSMLDAVDADKNVTKTEGNVKLEISNLNQSLVDFTWTYVDENGVLAVSKNVVFNYREGMLETFLDNWDLYTIAAEPVLSSGHAVAIALGTAEDYSWTVENTENGTVTVSDFKIVEVGNASLCYLNYRDSSSARGGDPFVLYPSWYVPLGFDKVYAGGVSGVTVRVWADTGGVSGIGYMVVGDEASLPVSEPAVQVQEQALILTFLVGVIFAVTLAFICFSHKRKYLSFRAASKRLLKFCTILFCILALSTAITLVPNAKAIPFTHLEKSRIYASTYGQIDNENNASLIVCDTLEDFFNNAGYNTANHYGSQTTRNTILNQYWKRRSN